MAETITPAGYLTRRDLAGIGWSLALVRKLMPKACATQEKKRGIYVMQVALYRKERVEAEMKKPEFAAALERRKHRLGAPDRRMREFGRKYSSWRGALQDACAGLHSLNRYAKHATCSGLHKEEIYELKNRLIELLYRSGYCEMCFVHTMTRDCRECEGNGCERCDFSGVWRRFRFYVFRFSVGRGYTWHQPDNLVKFPVKTTREPSEWEGVQREKPLLVSKSKFGEVKDLIRWVLSRASEGKDSAEPECLPVRELGEEDLRQESLF